MQTAISRLTQEHLPASALAYLDNLPAAEQERLAEQVLESMQQKDERVERALNRALEVVPAPLRGAVRKILFS
jgi:hypothetical protein